jgi:hypothetical protein
VKRHRHRVLSALVLIACSAVPAGACELVLSEHRSGQALARLALPPGQPAFDIAFTHSVLGTPVTDRYVWRQAAGGGRAHLVEEWFEGEGYGLPASAAPGETLSRVPTPDGPRWRLQTDRPVHPLVVRPLPALHMRVLVAGHAPLPLGELTTHAVLLQALNCPIPRTLMTDRP